MSKTESALATLENAGNIPLREKIAIARNSGLIPVAVRTDEAAALILIKAHEFGVPWTQAFSAFHVINGVCSCGAQFMLAKAYERLPEFAFELLESDSDKCRAKMRRSSNHAWMTIGYTFAQAQQAGLAGKPNWKAHPDDMLRNRVVSKLLKMIAPDIYMGIYTEDEAEGIKSIPHAEVDDATAARRVQAKLTGAPPPPDPAPPDAPPEDPPGEVVDAEPEPPEGSPPDVPATADWEQAIDGADSGEALATSLGQIAKDERLTGLQQLALRTRAAAVATSRGAGPAPWLALIACCATRAELEERFGQLKAIAGTFEPTERAGLKKAMEQRAGELAALEAGGTEGGD